MAVLTRAVAALLIAAATAAAQPADVAEDDIKAAFLYNFAKYVAWPPTAASDMFRICVVAEPGFVKRVDNLIAGETIEGRPVTRDTPATADAARSCHILYIGAADSGRGERLLAPLRAAPVLTVSDAADFLARGGIVAFVRDGDRVRFDVNNAAAQRAGLTVSSRLLRLARRVEPLERGR